MRWVLIYELVEAEAFARADPYVIQGLVKSWAVRRWNEVLEAQ